MNLLLPEVIGLASSTQRNRNAHWQNFLRFYINICNFEYPIPKFSVEFKVLEMYNEVHLFSPYEHVILCRKKVNWF